MGDSGTFPEQYGHVMVRAQSQLVAIAFLLGSAGKSESSFSSRRAMNLVDSSLNRELKAAPYRKGRSTVAFITSHATGFKSLAVALAPSRTVSNGMLPPPAVGSKTLFPTSVDTSPACGLYMKARG